MRLLAGCIFQKGNISCGLQRKLAIILSSMSRHIPEREYFGQGGQELPSGPRPKIAREGRGDLNPLTPTVGVIGEIGRTPIPVAESTRHPGEKPLPSVREHEREELDHTGESTTSAQGQGGTETW